MSNSKSKYFNISKYISTLLKISNVDNIDITIEAQQVAQAIAQENIASKKSIYSMNSYILCIINSIIMHYNLFLIKDSILQRSELDTGDNHRIPSWSAQCKSCNHTENKKILTNLDSSSTMCVDLIFRHIE